MKKISWMCLFLLLCLPILAQEENIEVDSISDEKDEEMVLPLSDDLFRYKLYPTENMWNFIKLDTRTGKMWMVQFSLESDKRFEYGLSERNLATWSLFNGDLPNNGEITGRFELHATENTYNFLLLDRIKGRVYQVQWSFDEDERFVDWIY
mgnify:FL=1